MSCKSVCCAHYAPNASPNFPDPGVPLIRGEAGPSSACRKPKPRDSSVFETDRRALSHWVAKAVPSVPHRADRRFFAGVGANLWPHLARSHFWYSTDG